MSQGGEYMISTEEFLNILKTDEKKVFKLGKIDANLKVKFDGETVASTKVYKRLSSYTPVAADRVLLVAISGTYVILGKVI